MFNVSHDNKASEMHCASEMHLIAAKRVLRYIKGTIDYGVKFEKCQEFKLYGFSDSD